MTRKQSAFVLLGILTLAALVRLWGIGYGLPCTYCRPDEDRLITTSLRLSRQDPNPHYFIWPGLFFYLSRGVLEAAAGAYRLLVSDFTGSSLDLYRADPAFLHLVLRYIFCAFGVASVFFLYRLGKKMFSAASGLLAAFFLSFSFLHARDSHFAMLDIPATLLALICFLRIWHVYRRGKWSDYLRAGLWCGLALSTKYYGGLLLIPLAAAHLFRSAPSTAPIVKKWFAPRFWVALLLSIAVLAVTSPYLFLDAASAWRQIREDIFTSQFVEGFDLVPGVQTARGWLYHLTFSLRRALGWPLEIICLLGVVLAWVRGWRGDTASRLILAFLLPFYAVLSPQKSCFIRYTTMLLPFLCLLGAELVVRLGSRKSRFARLIIIPLILLAVYDSALRLVRHNILLSRPDTRELASRWMETNIPRNSLLLFRNPLIFGRPFASFGYPHRVSLPAENKVEFLDDFLSFSTNEKKYLIIDEHPLDYSSLSLRLKDALTEAGELIYRVEGFDEKKTWPIYDPFDAYYVPLSGFKGVRFPGPAIEIYRLEGRED